MEYLTSVRNHLKTINENNIQYLNVMNHPELVYGNTVVSNKVDFCKYTEDIQEEMKNFGTVVNNAMQHLKTASCGCRIRFRTTSRRLVFKVELKRPSYFNNMVGWNSSGLEIFIVDEEGNYSSHRIIGPQDGFRIFAEQIAIPPNSSLCIFLPNYNTILNMLIGIERGSRIKEFKYPKDKRNPILFYGNSITQGASASKTSNSFPNIVSRRRNQDIINLSTNLCCRATPKTAEMIGDINCEAIVIDYSKDVPNSEVFKQTHENFYMKIREHHPDKKIIILTTALYNNWKEYKEFDDIIRQTYENAVKRGENTLLLNQRELFSEEEYDYVAIENNHYTDYGMFKVADKICELLDS